MFETDYQRLLDVSPASLPFRPVRESVLHWLDELPLAQPENALADMTDALRGLHRTDLSAPTRLELLELMRTQLLDTQKYLENGFLEMTFPPSKAAQAKGRLLAEASEMALGVYDRLRRSGDELDEKGRSLVVQRWFEWAANLQRASALLYRRPPKGYWGAVYEYYRELEPRPRALLPALSPFKHILLFSLTDAHRFDQREIREIYNWSGKQAAFLDICREPVRGGQEKALFGLRLDQDAPPAPLERSPADSSGEWRFLMTAAVVDALRHEGQSLQAAGQSQLLLDSTRQLLVRLIEEHVAPRRRRRQRNPATATPRIVVGWAQLLAVLPAPDVSRLTLMPLAETAESQAAPGAASSANLVAQSGGGHLRNHADFEFRHEVDIARSLESRFSRHDIWRADSHGAAPALIYTVKQQDASEDGACLTWEEQTSGPLKVGELVGIENAYGGWSVALVRRLEPASDGTWTFGVEFLGNAARAMAARQSDPSTSEAVLYLPGDAARELPERVLAPPRRFSVGAQILLDGAAGTRRMVLYEQVRSAACDCFLAAASRGKEELALL
ncbi:MAG TPA: hypothetical protein VI457_07705 [Methylococcaceae bacterium]|nr:hypothetical protein [Methylococcaceae bacterium]